jgi:hypothetical protein
MTAPDILSPDIQPGQRAQQVVLLAPARPAQKGDKLPRRNVQVEVLDDGILAKAALNWRRRTRPRGRVAPPERKVSARKSR